MIGTERIVNRTAEMIEPKRASRYDGVAYEGNDHPRDPAERCTLAWICHDRKLYATAARLRAEAMEADPKLGNDLRTALRYNAASAALVGCDMGQDEPPLDDARKADLRRQALDWLRLDLALHSRQSATGTAEARQNVARLMACWKIDPDFSCIRDAMALVKLTDAEANGWRILGDEVESLMNRAERKVP